jgi:hypothetical protein
MGHLNIFLEGEIFYGWATCLKFTLEGEMIDASFQAHTFFHLQLGIILTTEW